MCSRALSVPTTNRLQFFGIFAAFSLAFWYGGKAFLEGTVDDVGTIIM